MYHAAAIPQPAADLEMRQLRHHTKNALARILAQISSELSASSASRRVMTEVERRVLLTAQISDALFGLTRAPGPFAERLGELCDGLVELMGDDGQCIHLTCDVQCQVPLRLQETVLRVAHEFVGNALKHGMHVRVVGRIEVTVRQDRSGLRLRVADDGWGCGSAPRAGEGMGVSAALAEVAGGSVSLVREDPWTIANLHMPSVSLGAYQVVEQAVATTECGREAGLAFLHGIVEDAKAFGLVAQASAASRQRGAEVALPAVP